MKKLQISFAMLMLAIAVSTTVARAQKTPGGVTPTALYNFGTHADDPINVQGSLALGRDANLYGTSIGGGAFANGTIFKFTFATGKLKVLHSFAGTDGQSANGVTLGIDGNLYYVAREGGANGFGTIGRIDQNGKNFTTLFNFTNGSDGGAPWGP